VDFIGGILSNMVTFVVIGMIMAVGYKVFQMGSDLREIKDLLEKMSRRADEGRFPVTPSSIASGLSAQSPEDLIRAIHAAGIPDLETDPHPVANSSEV
jgi:hypothetical protein